jgi:hypothetical protein
MGKICENKQNPKRRSRDLSDRENDNFKLQGALHLILYLPKLMLSGLLSA